MALENYRVLCTVVQVVPASPIQSRSKEKTTYHCFHHPSKRWDLARPYFVPWTSLKRGYVRWCVSAPLSFCTRLECMLQQHYSLSCEEGTNMWRKRWWLSATVHSMKFWGSFSFKSLRIYIPPEVNLLTDARLRMVDPFLCETRLGISQSVKMTFQNQTGSSSVECCCINTCGVLLEWMPSTT